MLHIIKLFTQKVRYSFTLMSLFIAYTACLAYKGYPHSVSRTLISNVKKAKTPPEDLFKNPLLGVLPIHIDTSSDTVFVLLGNNSTSTPWSECSKQSDTNENNITSNAIANGARQLCAYFQEEHFRDYAFKSRTSALKYSIKYLNSLPCYGPFFQKQHNTNDAIVLVEVPPVTSSEVINGPYQEESNKTNFKWFDFEALLESTKTDSFTKEYGLQYSLAPHFVQLMRSNYGSLKKLIDKLKKQKTVNTGISLAKCLNYLEDSLHNHATT